MRSLGCLALLLYLWAGIAFATSYLITPDGTGDFPTIQAAIDAAGGGDIIQLADGTLMIHSSDWAMASPVLSSPQGEEA